MFVWSACRRLFDALASISGLDSDCVLVVEENVRTAAVISSGWCGATSTFLVRRGWFRFSGYVHEAWEWQRWWGSAHSIYSTVCL